MTSSTIDYRRWKLLALVVIFLGTFVAAAFGRSSLEQDFSEPTARMFFYVFCVVAVLLSPLQMLAIVGVQQLNRSAAHWERPTLDSGIVRNPLGLAHFATLLALATGAAWLLGSIFAGWFALVLGVTCLLLALGWYIGLRWAMHLHRHKFASGQDECSAGTADE